MRAIMYLDSQETVLEEFEYRGEPALKVKGIALTEGEWNKVWFNHTHLKEGVEKLCPENVCTMLQLRANHSKDVWDIVGVVNNFVYDPRIKVKSGEVKRGIRYAAEVRLTEAVERVVKGLWGPVSVGVWGDLHRVDTGEKDEDENPIYRVEARNLEFEHLAWVTNPACKDAGLTEVLNQMESEDSTQDSMMGVLPQENWTVAIKDESEGKERAKTESPEPNENSGVDKEEVKTMAEDENQPEGEVEEAQAVETEGTVAEAETETPIESTEPSEAEATVEAAQQAMQVKDRQIEELKAVLTEYKGMVSDLMEANKPVEEAPVEEVPSEAVPVEITETETEPEPAPEPEKTKVNLVEKILEMDAHADRATLEASDEASLDMLLSYLIRSKERPSVEGMGVVDKPVEVRTVEDLSEKELTKMAIQAHGNDWVLGQIVRSLYAKPKSLEYFKEI